MKDYGKPPTPPQDPPGPLEHPNPLPPLWKHGNVPSPAGGGSGGAVGIGNPGPFIGGGGNAPSGEGSHGVFVIIGIGGTFGPNR